MKEDFVPKQNVELIIAAFTRIIQRSGDIMSLFINNPIVVNKSLKYMDCVNKIHVKCFSFLFIEQTSVLIDTAY